MQVRGIKRTAIYLAAFSIAVAIITFVGSSYPTFTLNVQNLTLTIAAEILAFEFDIVVLLCDLSSSILETLHESGKKEIVQVLTGEKEVIEKAEEMIRSMKEDEDIFAAWCIMGYTKTLQKYFGKFLGKKVYRLINTDTVDASSVKDHLMQFLNEIRSGNYHIHSTTHSSSEFLIIGRRELLELIPHAVAGKMYRGLYTTDDHIVNAYVRDFQTLQGHGTTLEISAQDDAEKLIDNWIRSTKS